MYTTLYNSLHSKVISFNEQSWPTFHSESFEKEMRSSGIDIPFYLQNQYILNDQKLSTVYPPEQRENPRKEDLAIARLFKKALVEWYFPKELSKDGFYWKD